MTINTIKPHCNCQGCYELNKLPVPRTVKYGQANIQVTSTKDGDTCTFCGHYVMWRQEGYSIARANKRGAYKIKQDKQNAYYDSIGAERQGA